MKKKLTIYFHSEIMEQEIPEHDNIGVNEQAQANNTLLDGLVRILDRLTDSKFGEVFGAKNLHQGDIFRNLNKDL